MLLEHVRHRLLCSAPAPPSATKYHKLLPRGFEPRSQSVLHTEGRGFEPLIVHSILPSGRKNFRHRELNPGLLGESQVF